MKAQQRMKVQNKIYVAIIFTLMIYLLFNLSFNIPSSSFDGENIKRISSQDFPSKQLYKCEPPLGNFKGEVGQDHYVYITYFQSLCGGIFLDIGVKIPGIFLTK
jgi:hypothetical protein